ncbi:uncharacterized protein LOC128550433 [Mercenaria mercenaria]|uniref:uncharacterized protein LOC128550433 n=1 Tax=Mercenaria mercenaria TaxID=6596 RepID=UPI00234F5E81|nr:uncharacterized protein LOC128550433 [Mercenaria mercenaria]
MGIQKRHRTCTNPYPLRYGDHCFGDTMDVKLCKEVSCDSTSSDASVAFNAYGVTDISPNKGQTMVFSTVLTNKGDSYNSSTGVFVAPRNGTYIFHAQMCISRSKHMHFDIMVERTSYATAYGYAYNSCECPSIQAVVELKTKERVFVQWGTTWSYVSTSVICKYSPYHKNYFSGVLNHG